MADLKALMNDTTPLFEEMADSLDAVSRTLRALVLLHNANVDPEKMVPYLESGMRLFADLPEMGKRLEILLAKHRA